MNLQRTHGRRRLAAYGLLLIGFQTVCGFAYRDALPGRFLSDDLVVITENPYVHGPLLMGLRAFDPASDASAYVGGNYAPLTHVVHALQARFMRQQTSLYHGFNVAVHALNATLLVGLICSVGVPLVAAVAAGALFALHPANVEAVAWISQMRTLLAMTCMLSALLLLGRGSRLSTLPFAAGLLFKASAAAALPAAVALYWSSRRQGDRAPDLGGALAIWVVVFAAYAPIQFGLFSSVAAAPVDPYPNLLVQLSNVAAFGGRYAVMAVSGYGVSAYHVPVGVVSPLHAWSLAGLLIATVAGWWIWRLLRRGDPQAAFWVLAAGGFAPISQLLPFTFPMADRYLYFILPGFFVGVLLWGAPAWRGFEARLARLGPAWVQTALRGVTLVLVSAWVLVFAVETSARAGAWTSWEALYADSARHYPDGFPAHYLHALNAVRAGDVDAALRHLERYVAADGHLNWSLESSRHFYALEGNARYEELLRTAARRVVDVYGERTSSDDLARLSLAFVRLGDFDAAVARIEAALADAEEHQAELFTMLTMVRGARAAHERGDGSPRGASDQPSPSE